MAENLAGRESDRPRGDPPVRRAAEGEGRLPGPEGQPVRLRDHEDQRDLADVPRTLPRRAGTRERVRGRAVVFDGSDDYHHRINDPALGIDEDSHPGDPRRRARSAGRARRRSSTCSRPIALIKRGIMSLPTLGDGRQSGTSDSPSILNASPGERGRRRPGVAAHRRRDPHRPQRRAAATCWSTRPRSRAAAASRAPPIAESQTPWEEIYREKTGQLGEGGVLEFAVKYRGIAASTPRHNH